MAKGRKFRSRDVLEEARVKQGESEGPQDYAPFDPNDPAQAAQRAEAQRKALYPSVSAKTSGEVGGSFSAQYASEEDKRRRFKIATDFLEAEIADGRISVSDEREKQAILDKIMARLERFDQQRQSAAELSRLSALPGEEPEVITPAEPSSPEEIAMQKGLSQYMGKTLQNVAAQKRKGEREELAKSAEELAGTKAKRDRIQALQKLLQSSGLPEDERKEYGAELAKLKGELDEEPGLPAVGAATGEFDPAKYGARPGWTPIAVKIPGKGLEGQFLVKRKISKGDIASKVDAELKKLIDSSKTMQSASPELIQKHRARIERELTGGGSLQRATDAENQKLQGQRLLAVYSLEADPRFSVSLHRTDKGIEARGKYPGQYWDEQVAKGVKPDFSYISDVTITGVQKKLEDIARTRGVEVATIDDETPERVSSIEDAPSAELTPADYSADTTIDDFAPEGGWQPASDEANEMITDDDPAEEERYYGQLRSLLAKQAKILNLPPHHPDRKHLEDIRNQIFGLERGRSEARAIEWGDYWRSKTPEEIEADPTDPRDIDPRMADDKGLSEDQYIALMKKIKLGKRFGGYAGQKTNKYLSAAEENNKDLADVRERIAELEAEGGVKSVDDDKKLQSYKKREARLLQKQREIETGQTDWERTKDDVDQSKYPKVGTGRDRVVDIYDEDEFGRTKKRKYTIYHWERPPAGSEVHPEMAKNRAKIQEMIPFLRAYFQSLSKFADQVIKPKNIDLKGWHKEFDRFGKGSEVSEMDASAESVDADAPCSSCGHPASSHEGWPHAAFECNHKDCQFVKKTRTGDRTDSKCPRYKVSKLKSEYKPKKMRHGELSPQTIDILTKELAKLPSTWGSSKAIPSDPPPVTPEQLASADVDTALEMQKAIARWYSSFNPEKVGIMPSDAKTMRPVPPHSREKIDKVQAEGGDTSQMIKDNEEWYKRMEKRAHINNTLLDNVKIISNWAERARKNMWKDFYNAITEKWRDEIFGDSYPDMLSVQKKFINNNVFGPTKGVGVLRGRGEGLRGVRGELPFAEKFQELQRKRDIDRARRGHGAKGKGQPGKPSMTKWEMDDWRGAVMASRHTGMSPEKMQQRLDDMRLQYEQMSDKISQGTLLGTSIIQFVNRLARSLAKSGGWGSGADEETIEKRGSTERAKGVDYETGKKKKAGKHASPVPPMRVPAADAEARKAAERASDPKMREKDVAQAQYDAARARLDRQQVFVGTPKMAGDVPFEPSTAAPAPVAQPTEYEQRAADLQGQGEEELRSMGIDPEFFYADIEGTDKDKGRLSERINRRLKMIAEYATADRKPKWYDDL